MRTLLMVLVCIMIVLLMPRTHEHVALSASPDPIAFSKLKTQQSGGLLTVIGEAQNRTAKVVSFFVTVGLYSPDGNLLGTATGAVNELHPGRVKIFQAVANLTLSGTVRLAPQVDSITPACP